MEGKFHHGLSFFETFALIKPDRLLVERRRHEVEVANMSLFELCLECTQQCMPDALSPQFFPYKDRIKPDIPPYHEFSEDESENLLLVLSDKKNTFSDICLQVALPFFF